ncbi:G-type lectin S-receptor-like serine/threonine-protein kinase At2g19130 isoform X2 [Phragmites australis]|uniref:G-type lectin S-receptor-like serine/threonine-protein kinase At2g19130 isoform X2 n=1 Tax=Phragmites australis TaxID=29695 RepID=UPI002D767FC8|nr:G-type lectin S-receptor-like serine/threonine-protein kinase At2g19130 isoform X2 [Phragmites australis]
MPPLYILLLGPLILFSSLHAPSSSAADDTLTAGQALAAGDKLVSRNGKFALGFFQPSINFGMAAVVGREFSRVLTTFRGTVGYLAPEWLSGVAITPKVDVYSFGMVLLEIISGRRNSPEINSGSSCHVEYFPMRAIRKLHEGDVQTLMDPQLHGNFNLEEAERVCKVACWCIQDNEHNRPTMGEAVQILEGLQEVGMPPMPRLLAAITECSDGA